MSHVAIHIPNGLPLMLDGDNLLIYTSNLYEDTQQTQIFYQQYDYILTALFACRYITTLLIQHCVFVW